MAGSVQELTQADFEATIGSGVTLVDFWAPWCGPCRMQGPILEEVAASLDGEASIAKVNVDDHAELAGPLGVQSIPTLILFKDGQEVQRFVGVQDASTLLAAIRNAG